MSLSIDNGKTSGDNEGQWIKPTPSKAIGGAMPENESLVLARSRRWQRVGDSFQQREPATVTATKAFRSLLRTIQRVRKILPFAASINAAAASNQDELRRLRAECGKGHDYFAVLMR